MRRPKEGYVLIVLLIILIFILGFLSFLVFNSNLTNSEQIRKKGDDFKDSISISVSPTPFPFQDLTISYLKSRNYLSSLEIFDKVSESSGYSSYITSYDSDGLKLYGLLTKPAGSLPDGGWPAVIFIHGYIPPKNYKTTENYISWIDNLARNGFVVFKIDLRGHDKSEGEAGGAYYSGDYIIDTLNAYSALQNSGFVNPKKIGLWGHSMAGNVVLRSMAAKPEIPAFVIWAGAGYTYSDLREYRIQDSSYQPPPKNTERAKKRAALREAYGEFSPEHWFWKQVPATNYLGGIKSALQLQHAQDDNVVSIEYSRNLMKILDSSEVKHELIEYSSGGHNLTGASFSKALEETTKFFMDNLFSNLEI